MRFTPMLAKMQDTFQLVLISVYITCTYGFGAHPRICPLLVQLLSRHTQLARPQHVCWSTSECSVGSCVVEAMKEMSIETLFFAVWLSITCCLLASNFGGFASWVRTAWMLRKLPKSKSNRVYGGLLDMLSSNRLRAAQRMNEEIVSGSGVFYFNALWRQVGVS